MNIVEMPGKAATLYIGIVIAVCVIAGLTLALKALVKSGFWAFVMAVVMTGFCAFIVSSVLTLPDIAGDAAKKIEKQSNEVKSKIPVGG